MANARRGISELLRSGKGKRFRSSGYDLLADGEDLVRSDRDEDDEEQDERPAKGAAARKGAQSTVESKKTVASKSTSTASTGNKSRHDAAPSKPLARAGASSRDDVKVASHPSKQIVAKKGTSAKSTTVTEKAIVAKSATETPKKMVAKAATVAKKDVVAKTATISETATIGRRAGSTSSPESVREEVVAKKDTVAKSDTVRSVNAWLPSGHLMVSQSATIANVDTVATAATISRISDDDDGIIEAPPAGESLVAVLATVASSDIVATTAIDSENQALHRVDGVVAEKDTIADQGTAAAHRSGPTVAEGDQDPLSDREHGSVFAKSEISGIVAKAATIANKATSAGMPLNSEMVADVATSAVSATIAETDTVAAKGVPSDEAVVSETATTSQPHCGRQNGYSSQSGYSYVPGPVANHVSEKTVADSATVAKRDAALGQATVSGIQSPSSQRLVAESEIVAEKATNLGGQHPGNPQGTGGVSLQGDSSQNGYHSQSSNQFNGHSGGDSPFSGTGLHNRVVANSAIVAERDTGFHSPEMLTASPNFAGGPSQIVAKSDIGAESATAGFSDYQAQRMVVAETATVANSATHRGTTASYQGHTPTERAQPAPTQSSIPDHGVVPLPFWVLRMIRQDELSMREIRVFLTILEECLASGTGTAEISANDLMTRTQIHRTHIFSSVKGLLEKNLIVKDKTDAASKNVYRLNFDVGSAR
ncbi:MAG: hypothetical protein FJ146_17145 [Deltaproteobacteria bacterium]|nr:hypothetical protein [Deltaproteobacteria bacterium]